MATVLTRGANGVSYGLRATVSAAAETDGELIVDFQVNLPLASIVQITRAGVVVGADAVITYPADGQVSIADGSTYSVTESDVISVVAQYARIV